MRCKQTINISAYMDAELDDTEKRRFETHLGKCSACKKRLDGYGQLRGAFMFAERHTAPAWFSTRVMSRVANQRSRRFVLFPAMVRLAETMVLLLMITIGIISGRLLVNGGQGQMMANVASSFSLDVFEPAPPESLGGAYLAMTETDHEE